MKTLAKYNVWNHCVIGEKTFKNILIGPGKLPGLSRNRPQAIFTMASFTTTTRIPENPWVCCFLLRIRDSVACEYSRLSSKRPSGPGAIRGGCIRRLGILLSKPDRAGYRRSWYGTPPTTRFFKFSKKYFVPKIFFCEGFYFQSVSKWEGCWYPGGEGLGWGLTVAIIVPFRG